MLSDGISNSRSNWFWNYLNRWHPKPWKQTGFCISKTHPLWFLVFFKDTKALKHRPLGYFWKPSPVVLSFGFLQTLCTTPVVEAGPLSLGRSGCRCRPSAAGRASGRLNAERKKFSLWGFGTVLEAMTMAVLLHFVYFELKILKVVLCWLLWVMLRSSTLLKAFCCGFTLVSSLLFRTCPM